MRILITIPHFYRASTTAAHGSESADASRRVQALTACLLSMHQTFGPEQAHMEDVKTRCNDGVAATVDVVICTTGEFHLLRHIPSDLFRQHSTQAEPRLLGYECHEVLSSHAAEYDYLCFLEDDLIVQDPLFFWKIGWFSNVAGENAVLQPHRFELSPRAPVRKLYIDGPLVNPAISPQFQDRSVRPRLDGSVMGRRVSFERVDNPHAGCFFLTSSQMQQWMRQPYFLDRAQGFWGPLESAATLGLMRTFDVYKPAAQNAGFLEVRHLDQRYLDRRLRFPDGFQLGARRA
jgi:hypothetical protein